MVIPYMHRSAWARHKKVDWFWFIVVSSLMFVKALQWFTQYYVFWGLEAVELNRGEARKQLPRGKKRHLHAVVFGGLAHQTAMSADVVVSCLRGAFLSMFVERHVHRMVGAQRRGSFGWGGHNLALSQAQSLETQRRRVGESCTLVLVVDALSSDLSPGTEFRQRIDCASERGVPAIVVTEDQHYDGLKRRLQAECGDRLATRQLRVENMGKGAKRLADKITRVVDAELERAGVNETRGAGGAREVRAKTATVRDRGLSVTEKRDIERKVGVRGGLAAALRNKDPHFTFRLAVTCAIMWGMAYQTINGGKFATYEDSASVDTSCQW
eukprot:g8046.t1